jgi:hypothetical protein
MTIKHAKILIPAEAGISSMPGQGLNEVPAGAGMTGLLV